MHKSRLRARLRCSTFSRVVEEHHIGTPALSSTRRLEWADVFRGGAALGVALFHARLFLWIGLDGLRDPNVHETMLDRIGAAVSIPFHFGYDGVMVFFVLSGFVIHLPYADARRPFLFGTFVLRRFVRLYPPYLAAIALSYVVACATSGTAVGLGAQLLKSVVMLQNYPHGGGPHEELSMMQPVGNIALWSLPVEFELYLVYPLWLAASRRFGMARATFAVGFVSIIASIVEVDLTPELGHGTTIASFLPTFLHYWIVWISGAWLAQCVVRHSLPRWTIVLTGALVRLLAISILAREHLHLAHQIEDYCVAAFTLLSLVLLNQQRGGLDVFERPALAPLRALGSFSYSLYLVHMPIVLALIALSLHFAGRRPADFFVVMAETCLTLPLAWVFYMTFERPSIAIGKRIGRLANADASPIRAPVA